MPRFWEVIKATYITDPGPEYWRDALTRLDATLAGLHGAPEEMALCRKLLQAYGEYLEEKDKNDDNKRYTGAAGQV